MESVKDNSGESRKPKASPPPSTDELNDLIPGYQFVEYLDSGGMGAVYKAVQKSLNRTVAVKLLPRVHLEKEGFAERFKREAHALALLNHPNIIAVHDSGETRDGQMYYAMEFVSGMDLQQLLRKKPPAPKQILQIITQVCNALQYAHERGIVHRDIKPANILIDDAGNVKVADFGLVKIVGPQAVDYTATGTTLGTPDYIAPEAMEYGVKIDHRVDIYSLGVMIYELLTGHVPKGQWEPPSIRSGADKKVDAMVSKAMQNDPDKRYQHVSEMTQVLEKLLKTCDNWKHYRRPPKTGVVSLGDAGGQVATEAMTQKLRQDGSVLRSGWPAWTLVGTALLVVVGAMGAWQAGWFFPSHQPALTALPVAAAAPASAEVPPDKAVVSPPSSGVDESAQARLSHWVIEHGGFLNVLTPETMKGLTLPGGTPATWPPTMVPSGSSTKLIGGSRDLRSSSELPGTEPFVVWRVSFLESPIKHGQEFKELVELVRAAGSVYNLNLHGLDVPAEDLPLLSSMTSLVSLDLTASPVINSDAIPHLGACKQLRLLLLGGDSSLVDEAMLAELRALLPLCGVHTLP